MKLLTRADVAELLKVSQRTVDRLRVRGLLPAAKIQRTVRFTEDDVRRYVEAQKQGGPS